MVGLMATSFSLLDLILIGIELNGEERTGLTVIYEYLLPGRNVVSPLLIDALAVLFGFLNNWQFPGSLFPVFLNPGEVTVETGWC